MAFILDNLIAVFVGTVVILAIIALQLDTQTSNTQTIGAEVTRGALVDFVQVLEHDLRNVTAPPSADALVSWSDATPTAAASVTVLDFYSVIDTAATAVPQRVQYELVLSDSVEVTTGTTVAKVATYTMRRLVETGGAFAQSGQSPYGMTEFAISPLRADGAAAASAADARALAVRTAFIPRWGGESVVRDARFETVFRPPGLSF